MTGLLGTGGFASVWLASRTEGGLPVALKVGAAGAQAARRMELEAAALARVGPPQAPAVVGRGTLDDGRPYLAMERLPGPSLAAELAAWPQVPPLEVVVQLSRAVLTAVAAVHARGVVHRDLKPENVFLSGSAGDRRATLIDFGLAEDDRETGTPEYMAPEQIEGRPVGPPADVYALGVMLYELATLRVPFVGDRRSLEYAHLSYRPPAPSRFAPVPAGLEAIVLRCLAKPPSARFPDAGALLAAFDQGWADARSPVEQAGGRPAPAPAAGGRQRAALLFIHQPGLAAAAVQAVVRPIGGQLAHVAGDRGVCTFLQQGGAHPGQRATAAAQALFDAGHARRLVVDLAPVTVKPRPEGPPRILSPLFADGQRYPDPAGPEGIHIAPAARDTLGYREQADSPAAPIQRSPLCGRDEELAALLVEATQATTERRPSVATVLGESGMGKSRLAMELIDRLGREGGVEIILLTAREPLGPDADQPLAELLRRGLELDDQPGDLRLLQQRLGDDEQQCVAAAALLGWLAPDAPAVQSLRSAPGALRANVARAGQAALHRLAGRRPVVVLLDDAQLADDALLDALEQSTVAQLPLWVCALAQPSFARSRPTWGQRASSHVNHRLQPLDGAAAGDLCRALLEPVELVPQPVIARLLERSGGVPLRLQELVRGLRRRGLVRQQAGGIWCVATEVLDQLPDSPLFEWLATLQLEPLPGELAAHARLVALLAPEFSDQEVAGVLAALEPGLADMFPLDAAVGNERLVAVGLTERRRPDRTASRTTSCGRRSPPRSRNRWPGTSIGRR